MRRLLECPPTGKPVLLVSAMIDVAITGLYVATVADGLDKHAWQDAQLAVLQKQLADINVLPLVAQSFEDEEVASTYTLETTSNQKIAELFSKTNANPRDWFFILAPRGWIYQNMAFDAQMVQKAINSSDIANQLVSPREMDHLATDLYSTSWHSPYRFIAAIVVPNFVKAWQTTARTQTLVNEEQIVCALERYHLAHGEYPGALDALAPQFIEQLPHDIIGGKPLHYRRAEDGKFLLYSVGWNEKDDGGQIALTKGGAEDRTNGDWVWHLPMK